jgi:hypothetical protein
MHERIRESLFHKHSYLLGCHLLKHRKVILVTNRGDPQGCETTRFPYFLDNRLRDDGEVVSLACQAIPVTER